MKEPTNALVIQATAFHTPEWGKLEVLKDYLFCIGTSGKLEQVVSPADNDTYLEIKQQAQVRGNLKILSPGQYLLPGFVDLHIHAPQWRNMGKALHVPLEQWLDKYTFPLEKQMADLQFATPHYEDLIDTTLRNGTTTALYFGTQDWRSSYALAEIAASRGQRAAIGKIAMDNPAECPDYYRDGSVAEAVNDTEKFIDLLLKKEPRSEYALLTPVVMPRFTPSCTDRTLQAMGELAQRYRLPIHTHVAESNWIASYTQERFGKTDVEAMEDFGLLTAHTILAHGTMLTDSDAELLAQQKSTVAHCPISNAFFGNAVYPLAKRFTQGVNAGLGTDISGGFSPSLYDNIRQAIIVSRILEDGVNSLIPAEQRGVEQSRIDYRHAFYCATTGGGEALGLKVGLFAPGYAFDAQVIDINTPDSSIRIFPGYDDEEDVLQKILFLATRANIVSVWVQGKTIF